MKKNNQVALSSQNPECAFIKANIIYTEAVPSQGMMSPWAIFHVELKSC